MKSPDNIGSQALKEVAQTPKEGTQMLKMDSIPVVEAEYCLIAPFRITDWKEFNSHLPSFWMPNQTYKQYSLKKHIACYLGYVDSDQSDIVASGCAYVGDLQKSGDKSLTSWKGEIRFCKEGGSDHPDATLPVSPSNLVLLHIAPNRKCGLVLIQLNSIKDKGGNLKDAVSMNYYLHKSDSSQSLWMKMKTGLDKESRTPIFEVRGTLLNVFEKLLPATQYYTWENAARFITATYVQIDSSQKPDPVEVKSSLARLGQAKNEAYQITSESQNKATILFDNFWTYSSPEGFACIVWNQNPQEKESQFIQNSYNTFEQSYLPMYLTTVIADSVLTNALRNLDSVASDIHEQDRIRETRLAITLSSSHYEHLTRLLELCKSGRNFEDKYAAITDCIDARRAQLERERHDMEKAQQKLAEEERLADEKRDKMINYLLGFIGSGQVIFAILQLSGVTDIFGNAFSKGLCGQVISVIFSALFLGLIIWLCFKKKPK